MLSEIFNDIDNGQECSVGSSSTVVGLSIDTSENIGCLNGFDEHLIDISVVDFADEQTYFSKRV